MDQEDKQFWFILSIVLCGMVAVFTLVINYVNQLNQ